MFEKQKQQTQSCSQLDVAKKKKARYVRKERTIFLKIQKLLDVLNPHSGFPNSLQGNRDKPDYSNFLAFCVASAKDIIQKILCQHSPSQTPLIGRRGPQAAPKIWVLPALGLGKKSPYSRLFQQPFAGRREQTCFLPARVHIQILFSALALAITKKCLCGSVCG